MPIQLVVFDMAGTTVSDGQAVSVCVREALERVGVPDVPLDAINAARGLAKPMTIRLLLAQHGVQGADLEERAAAAHRIFVERIEAYYREDPAVQEAEGASEIFRALKEAGIAVALDTGFDRATANTILDRLGWKRDGLVDVSVTSDEVERGRPAPDLVLRAMALTGVSDPRGVAKVGDTPADLEEGTAAGCSIVAGITTGSHSRMQLLLSPHTHLIDRLGDLLPIVTGQG